MTEINSIVKKEILTLENIYKYASEEELSAIVHSIIGRVWELKKETFDIKKLLDVSTGNCHADQIAEIYTPTDEELHAVVKGLRRPQ